MSELVERLRVRVGLGLAHETEKEALARIEELERALREVTELAQEKGEQSSAAGSGEEVVLVFERTVKAGAGRVEGEP